MGDDYDVVASDATCQYACDKRDCDGDWNTFCTKCGECHYQNNVRDCDGDIITLCRL